MSSGNHRQEAPGSLDEIRQKLRSLMPDLSRNYGITSIEIFGSYVRGEENETSDLDLLVEFDRARRHDRYRSLRISGSNRCFLISWV